MDKKKPSKPHDEFYRKAISNTKVAVEFFKTVLPKHIVNLIDLNTLTPEKDSFADSHLGIGASDALFSVKIDKSDGYIYFLAEHQSTSDHFIALRLLKYMVMIWENYRSKYPQSKHLPIIYPIVYYTGKAKYSAPLDFFSLFKNSKIAKSFIFDPYNLMDLHRTSDAKIKETVWLGVMLFIMKYINSKDILPHLLDIKPMLMEVGKVNFLYLEAVFSYIIKKAEASQIDQVIEVFGQMVGNEGKEKLMTIADKLIERGMQKGIEQGIELGLQQGIEKGVEQTAINLIKKGQTTEFIAEVTGLSKEKIKKLSENSNKHYN